MVMNFTDYDVLTIDEMDAEEENSLQQNKIDNMFRALEDALNDPLDPME